MSTLIRVKSEHIGSTDSQPLPGGVFFLYGFTNEQIEHCIGRILTTLEASMDPSPRLEALKSLVKQALWSEAHDNRYSRPFDITVIEKTTVGDPNAKPDLSIKLLEIN